MKALGIFSLLLASAAAQSTTVDAQPPWMTGVVTPDGTCGGDTGFVCSPTWGGCCSSEGVCGRSKAFCGEGCQPSAGNCNAVTAPVEPPPPGSVSPDGSCGGTNEYKCIGSPFGDCCSMGNWCGNSTDHCGPGCLTPFGDCTVTDPNISTDGKCGSNGKTCLGSSFGDCCSAGGWCGDEDGHCGAGCQNKFGTCGGESTGDISTDGECGANGKTCKGSSFGDCCSVSGFCGGEKDHCGAGCQSKFGTCEGEDDVSTDGSCATNGKTCKGSSSGDCCSPSNFCGTTKTHCGAGCQADFGLCDDGAGDVSTDGKCGANGKTCKGSDFGDCCSASGNCGKTKDHCGAGCQGAFGTCDGGADSISTDGKCGSNGKTCKGSDFGDCCSSSGNCGGTNDHCGAGCQALFGTCNSGAGDISTDSECGSRNGKTCVGSGLGACCSGGGYCGSTSNHCGLGCQGKFSSGCLTSNIPTQDGSCGSSKGGLTCAGGDFNNQCCSANGFCGTSGDHCGSGCQRGFGRCN